MIRRQELYDRKCVASLIHVIEQVPLRADVRRPLGIHHSSVGLLLLWSVLRWERTFLIQTLERLGVNLWSLTRDVDEALTLCSKQARTAGTSTNSDLLDPHLRGWLNQTAAQARALRHDFLSGEHLLLALLADRDSGLAALLQRHGLTYDTLKQAVADALPGAAAPQALILDDDASGRAEPTAIPPGAVEDDPLPAKTTASTWIADIDRPAVGVPRRFGVFIMMLMVTLYVVLFSLLKMLRASNLVFGLLALLFTGIGVGQAVLFGGRYPRAASIWIGSILVPIEACVFAMASAPSHAPPSETVVVLLAVFLFGIPLGAVFGYLFGTLTAAGFYLVDWYEKRQKSAEESSAD